MVENSETNKLNSSNVDDESISNAESFGAMELVYVSDHQAGFSRIRNGKNFYFTDGKKKLCDPDQLERIKRLSIPPAWEKVWICKLQNGHLQATGIDHKGRKQYRYHILWIAERDRTKFYRLKEFGKKLPSIRSTLEKDLSLPGFPREKVLAAVVSLLEKTNIRVGNTIYEKLYGSFGLTTMKDRHVKIDGSELCFSFIGKKGIRHKITFRSKKLSRIVKGCKDIPGKELFVYYGEDNIIHCVDSGMVNDYIRNISRGDFTAKDFRTWTGSVIALSALNHLGGFDTSAGMNLKISAAFDIVAKQLGNTRTVCEKYYVHPLIVELYKEKKLGKYLQENEVTETSYDQNGLKSAEKVLLKIFDSYTQDAEGFDRDKI